LMRAWAAVVEVGGMGHCGSGRCSTGGGTQGGLTAAASLRRAPAWAWLVAAAGGWRVGTGGSSRTATTTCVGQAAAAAVVVVVVVVEAAAEAALQAAAVVVVVEAAAVAMTATAVPRWGAQLGPLRGGSETGGRGRPAWAGSLWQVSHAVQTAAFQVVVGVCP